MAPTSTESEAAVTDDLETSVRSILGEEPSDDVIAAMRDRIAAHVRETTSEPDPTDHEVHEISLRPEAKERPMALRGLVAAVAAAIVLIIGIITLVGTRDDGRQEAVENPTTSTSTADASAGCGLDESASISATVDESGESVTFDIASDPSCAGVEAILTGTPAERGLPIQRSLTLDDTGAARLTDQLLGTREGAQEWTVELTVADTGGVAATGAFAVTQVCDPENAGADLQATYLPESNEVRVVFTTDPVCAGTRFAFDGGNLFASSPRGGWNTYSVDEDGRVEITEELKADVGPTIGLTAQQAPENRGVLGSPIVARATLDIGG